MLERRRARRGLDREPHGLSGAAARADADHDPALGEVVERGGGARRHRDVARVRHGDAGAEANARGGDGAGGERHPQLPAHEVRVGDPDGVVAERLRESHLLDDDGEGLAAEDADVELHRSDRPHLAAMPHVPEHPLVAAGRREVGESWRRAPRARAPRRRCRRTRAPRARRCRTRRRRRCRSTARTADRASPCARAPCPPPSRSSSRAGARPPPRERARRRPRRGDSSCTRCSWGRAGSRRRPRA